MIDKTTWNFDGLGLDGQALVRKTMEELVFKHNLCCIDQEDHKKIKEALAVIYVAGRNDGIDGQYS